jgi:hypothetical protein
MNEKSGRKVLFLDIDGVLHPNGCVHLTSDGTLYKNNAFVYWPVLKEALEEFPDVDIVIHSTWRLLWESDDDLFRHLPVSLTAVVVGVTPRSCSARFGSIQSYCAKHKILSYVILDDEQDAFPSGLSELVVVPNILGLKDVECLENLKAHLRALSLETKKP